MFVVYRFAMADVMEVEPLPSESSEAAENSAPAQSFIAENGTEAKKVYLMSHIKWGVHSEVERVKWKYWYMVGPLKTWYCYLKTVSCWVMVMVLRILRIVLNYFHQTAI